MPTIAVAALVAIGIVLGVYAVAWFRGEAWPLGVLALIMVVSITTFLFNHAPAALVLGLVALLGLVGAVAYILWCFQRMMREFEP